MKINTEQLKKIIQEELMKEFVVNKFEGLKLVIDKTFMYPEHSTPYAELSIQLDDPREAKNLFLYMKNKTKLTKRLVWRISDDNEIYTQISFSKDLPRDRQRLLDKYVNQVKDELHITDEEIKKPYESSDY